MSYKRFCERQQRSWHQLANSSQQPTRGRSLARRFRASFCATLRVALPEREGRERLSERTLARPLSQNLCFLRDRVELLPPAPLPSAGCTLSVGRISLCVSGACEGARSRRAACPALARATLPRQARFGKAIVTFGA